MGDDQWCDLSNCAFWGVGVTDVQDGRAVDAGPIVERLERIWVHEFRLVVHALASKGGSAGWVLVMRNTAVSAGNDVHQWDPTPLVRIYSPFSPANYECLSL